MGQCGCADTSIDVKFPAPDGGTYGLEVYSSCDYCSNPAGVVLHRFGRDSEDAKIWLDSAESAEFHDLGYGYAQMTIPVLDPEKLAEVLSEDASEDDDEIEADIRREDIARALPEAVRLTLSVWRDPRPEDLDG
jgi:hypothetical protein